MHARDDRVVPAEEGRLLATLIPDAHFVLLDPPITSCSSTSWTWEAFLSEVGAFLGTDTKPGFPIAVAGLARGTQLLNFVSQRLTNDAIATPLPERSNCQPHLTKVYAKLISPGKGRAAAARIVRPGHDHSFPPPRPRNASRPPPAARELRVRADVVAVA